MDQYKLLTATSREFLELDVNNLAKLGWKLVGFSVAVGDVVATQCSTHQAIFCAAMVKEPPPYIDRMPG